MKKLILIIGGLLMIAPIFAVEIPRPFWVKTNPIPPMNSGYIFAWGEGSATDGYLAKNKAFADAIKKALYELGSISIDAQTVADIEKNGLKGFVDTQKRAIRESCTTPAIVTEDGNSVVYVLVQMQIDANYAPNFYLYPNGFNMGHDPQFDREMRKYSNKDQSLALKSLWRSAIVPGWGQIYKGSSAKGYCILGATAAGVTGIVVCENLRTSYIRKISEQPKNAVYYSQQADNWENGRNIAIGATAVIYVYNLIDAVAAKGPRKASIRGRDIYYSASPIVMENGSTGLMASMTF